MNQGLKLEGVREEILNVLGRDLGGDNPGQGVAG
jgi:hypothetical protein